MEQQFFGVSLEKLLTSGGQTLYMVALALIIGTVIGIVLALILVLCKKGGLAENLILYNIVSIYINIVRSIPFVILLVAIMPITRAIVGTTIGSTGGTCTTGRLYQSLSGTTDGEQSPGGQSGNPGSC